MNFRMCKLYNDSKWTGEVFVNILDNAVKVFAGAYRNPNSGNRACYLHDAGI